MREAFDRPLNGRCVGGLQKPMLKDYAEKNGIFQHEYCVDDG
jgi:hypothetical protein